MQRAVAVEPQVAEPPEAELLGVFAEEIECRATRVDVDGLPPGGAGAARVELGGRVQAGEVEIDDGHAARAALRERVREARADDPTSDDQDVGALARHSVAAGALPERMPARPL